MISEKIRALKNTLALAETTAGLTLNHGVVKLVQRQLSDIHAQVLALENAQVPPAQRVTREHLASGKVALLPGERPFS